MQTNTPNLPSWAESMVEPVARAMHPILFGGLQGDKAGPATQAARKDAMDRATAALAEALPMVLTEVERHLSACQYDPAPYTCLKHRLRTLSDGKGGE